MKIIIILSSLLFAISCNTMKDNNKDNFHLKINQKKSYTLVGNPTTGYSWNYEIANPEIVKIDTTKVIPQEQNKIGGQSNFLFSILGLKKGNTKIYFKYNRPWEKDVEPVKMDTLEVVVK